jgi:hypothetical protein
MVKVNIIYDNGYQPKAIHLEPEYVAAFASPRRNNFIETGTYKGETTSLMLKQGFKYLRSVDLSSENLLDSVSEEIRNSKDVYGCDAQLVLGDSPDAIPVFLNEIKKKWVDPNDREVVFWLDAHASGEIPGGRSGGSPLVDELLAIEKDDIRTHTIFIDDRRLFGSAEWSYITEEQCIEILRRINSNYKFFYLDGQVPGDVLVATVYDNRK